MGRTLRRAVIAVLLVAAVALAGCAQDAGNDSGAYDRTDEADDGSDLRPLDTRPPTPAAVTPPPSASRTAP